MSSMKSMHLGAYLLLFIGGLNWLLIGLFNYNVVSALLGGYPMMEKLVYIIVGVATVYVIATHKKDCKICSGKMK